MRYNGEYFRASKKTQNELIFFVHFYGGSKKALRRHIEWVNEEGYDAFAFDLVKRGPRLKHRYSLQIEELLNQIPGKKIVYSFSNPTAGTIEALGRRACRDVKALICDSGPSAKFIESVMNLFRYDFKYPEWRNYLTTPILCLLWDVTLHRSLQSDLRKFPKDFPVLTMMGALDPLIPPDHTEKVFDKHPHLKWEKLIMTQAGHLNGLRDFPEIYRPTVKSFLQKHSTKIV